MFDKDGNIIPVDQYQILLKGMMVYDSKLNNWVLIPPTTEKELKSMIKTHSFLQCYMQIEGKGGRHFIKKEDWEEQLTKPRNRLSVKGQYLTTTDIVARSLGRRWETDNIMEELLKDPGTSSDEDEYEEDYPAMKKFVQSLFSARNTEATSEKKPEDKLIEDNNL